MNKSEQFSALLPLYEVALKDSRREEDIHNFLAMHPEICLQAFSDGSAALYMLSKFRLGSAYVADFLVVGYRSFGFPVQCVLVELESPQAKPFTKSGVFSAQLNQAIRQVADWKSWMKEHFSEFAITVANEIGSRYEGADPALDKNLRSAIISFKIVIGRRAQLNRANKEHRATSYEMNRGVEIMSYDRVGDSIRYAAGLPANPQGDTAFG